MTSDEEISFLFFDEEDNKELERSFLESIKEKESGISSAKINKRIKSPNIGKKKEEEMEKQKMPVKKEEEMEKQKMPVKKEPMKLSLKKKKEEEMEKQTMPVKKEPMKLSLTKEKEEPEKVTLPTFRSPSPIKEKTKVPVVKSPSLIASPKVKQAMNKSNLDSMLSKIFADLDEREIDGERKDFVIDITKRYYNSFPYMNYEQFKNIAFDIDRLISYLASISDEKASNIFNEISESDIYFFALPLAIFHLGDSYSHSEIVPIVQSFRERIMEISEMED